jgi:hypothetical protein
MMEQIDRLRLHNCRNTAIALKMPLLATVLNARQCTRDDDVFVGVFATHLRQLLSIFEELGENENGGQRRSRPEPRHKDAGKILQEGNQQAEETKENECVGLLTPSRH